jgi:hypothetical protein
MILVMFVSIYILLAALVIVSVCVLSARMSQREGPAESPIMDHRVEAATSREYQTDAITS